MPSETAPFHADQASPSWLHFLLPSVSDLLFIALLFGLSLGALGRLLLRDSSTGWHIRDGQFMLLNHSITRSDPFSSTMNGHPWYAWEWLYDLGIAIIHHTLGLNGVVFYTAAIIASTFVLTLYLSLRRGTSLPVALVLLVLALGASAVHFLARPHVLSWLFTVVWFEVLDSSTSHSHESAQQLFWLPPLMLLWVNLHGGFVLGLVLLVFYLLVAVTEFVRNRTEERRRYSRQLSLVTLLCVIATFVNPYGYKLQVHIYSYLSDRFLMNNISEFLSPNFHGAAQQCFAALLLITIAAVLAARRKPTPAHLLVILLAAFSGLYATRNLPVSSLLLTLLMGPLLSETLTGTSAHLQTASWLRAFLSWLDRFDARMRNLDLQLTGHLWLLLAFAIGFWSCAHGGALGSTQLINAFFDQKRFPVESVDFLAQRGVREPVFSLDYWGGYLIYRLYPRRVVLDDRHDLYGDQILKDYLSVLFLQPDWEKMLDRQQVNWVLLPSGSSLANMLTLSGRWTLVHADMTSALFHRNGKLN